MEFMNRMEWSVLSPLNFLWLGQEKISVSSNLLILVNRISYFCSVCSGIISTKHYQSKAWTHNNAIRNRKELDSSRNLFKIFHTRKEKDSEEIWTRAVGTLKQMEFYDAITFEVRGIKPYLCTTEVGGERTYLLSEI